MSFLDRRRVRRARVVLADRAFPGGLEAHVVPSEVQPQLGATIPELHDRTLPIEDRLRSHGPLLQELAGELRPDDIAALDARLSDQEREVVDHAPEPLAGAVRVALAVHHGVEGVAERTGLSAATPPQSVHAMNYDTWVTGGDPGYADMIDVALADVGAPIGEGSRVLDFGCSSGRVVRMLAARRPDAAFEGCDVNGDAISWADSALPAVRFTEQPMRPPTPYEDDRFDAAFAISIWSHYAAEPGLAWLEEMRRIIKPGGHLLVTTHGEQAIALRASAPQHGAAAQAAIATALYRDGFVFVDTFGGSGDWGVVDSGWGNAFMTPEWLMNTITPAWSVPLYRAGGVEGHQDLYVLRRER